ncbi:MAG TPA: hypothetical protein VN999_13555 [Thermoanaerobaculia bacterium]|nr:hypothetical protein [Thermoanaerobaculia bacterium]
MSCPDWRRLDPAARDAAGTPHAAADAPDAIDASGASGPLGALHAVHWQQALSHLDTGCPDCWREALAVDPTLIFRRLPAPELTAAQEADEVEAACLAVAAMRTASRMEEAARGDAGSRSASGLRRRWRDWEAGSDWPGHALRRLPAIRSLPALHVQPARWALAAGLTAMALVYGSGHGWRPTPPTPPMTAATAPGAPAGALASSVSPSTQAGHGEQTGEDMRATAELAAAAAEPGGQGAPGPGWAGASAVQPASSRPSIEGLSRPEARVYQIDSPHMSVVMIVDGKLDV